MRVPPAGQGLAPGHPAERQLDLRLQVHDEIAPLHRGAQLVDPAQPQGPGAVPLGVVDRDPAAGRLGAVHGGVRLSQQVLGTATREHAGRDPHRRLHGQPSAVDVQRQGERLPQRRRDPRRGLGTRAGQQDGELVAAEPRQQLRRPQHALQPGADFREHGVARLPTEGDVDPFEAVDVGEQQGDLVGPTVQPSSWLRAVAPRWPVPR